MIRFVAFILFVGAIVAGILWVIKPEYLGLAPHPVNTVRTAPPVERSRVTEKDAIMVQAREGGSGPQMSRTLGGTFRDPVEIPSAMIRASASQDVSTQIERNLKEIYVQPGQYVRAGQVVALLDDSLAQREVQRAFIDWDSRTKIAIESAEAEYRVTKSIAERSRDLYEKKAISKQEYEIDVFRMERAFKEVQKAQEDHRLAKVVHDKAQRELEMHKLVSEVSGVVERVEKKKGETARVGEPIISVVSSDRLWVEGAVEQQFARYLRPGMRVQVLPERINPPVMDTLREHTEPITGLAISPDSQLLASSSKDGRVVVWDWRKGVAVWNSRAGKPDVDFESVAFSPIHSAGTNGEATYQLLAGCSDGSVQHWQLTVKASALDVLEVAAAKQSELKHEQGHHGPVTAVVFFPDGQFCATGGEDRQICFWSLNGLKFQYTLRAENNENETAHRGTVTALHFTPEGKLISAAADRTLKKWKLGQKGAELEKEIGGRSADVKQLSISNDGRLALFDHEEELRILNLADFSTLSVMTSRQQGHFKNLACFSPEADMILTTTTNGRLQLWSTPVRPEVQSVYRHAYTQGVTKNNFHLLGLLTARISSGTEFCVQSVSWAMTAAPQEMPVKAEGNSKLFLGVPELWNLCGHPFRQLQTPEATTETCGVFAPTAPFLFTGGTDKVIRVWARPTPPDVQEALEAVITFVGNQVEGGLIRVRAEMDNPTDPQYRLPVGTKVNMRAFPETGQVRRQPRVAPPATARTASTAPAMLGD